MLGFVPQTPLTITEVTSLRVNPSDTLRVSEAPLKEAQHFAYAGEPFRQLLHLGRPQDRTASPPQVFHRNGVAPQPTIYANFGFENTP